jgi:SAM-dependent methyltransferase
VSSNVKSLDALKRRVLQGAVIVERVDERGEPVTPRGIKRATSRIGQALVEHGIAPPWAMSREECQEFWATRADGSNAPVTYARKETGVVDFLNDFWGPEVSSENSVLEIGCNAGTNLNRLRELGFERLSGIEINPHALDELRATYPELAASADLVQGPIESALGAIPDGAFDVVFSMAVLIHLHPTSLSVFDDMARVARHVCVIELESASNSYVFPRSYRRVFERRGCTELRQATITARGYPEVSRDYDGYVARLFRTPAG